MNKLMILAAAATAGALGLPGLASAADVSGAWKLTIDAGDMMYHSACALTQSGEALTGTCTSTDPAPDGAPAPKPATVTGTVDGSNVKFAYDITFGDMTLHLDYAGALSSDTAMTGKLSVAGMDVDFSGTKS